MMKLFDSHAHLNDRKFAGDCGAVWQRAREQGVQALLNVGFDLPSSLRAAEQARAFPGVYAAVGIHPHDAASFNGVTEKGLRKLAGEERVVALGEIGLDYYRDLSPRPVQQEVFRNQLKLAGELGLPVLIHDRDAHEDVLGILKEVGGHLSRGGVLHCFSGSWQMARQCLDLGFYISLAGPVTYRNAPRPQEVARLVPLDRLLIETDCPYLAPEPVRGTRNEPANVAYVARQIAALRKMPPEELAEVTFGNACRVLRLECAGN